MAFGGRFQDSWVVDKVMFDFVGTGGCSCCGFSAEGFGMEDFMAACSDVETDAGGIEKKSPWPQTMQDEVWSNRVKFRRLLKESMPTYQQRFEEHGPAFVEWWMSLEPKARRRCFQMPKEELRVQFTTTYDFNMSYHVVLCNVLEQLEKFHHTGYKADGGTDCEIYFEEQIECKRGAWTVSQEYTGSADGCDMFFGMLLQLGGAHLLPKRPMELREEAARAKQAAEGGQGRDVRQEVDVDVGGSSTKAKAKAKAKTKTKAEEEKHEEAGEAKSAKDGVHEGENEDENEDVDDDDDDDDDEDDAGDVDAPMKKKADADNSAGGQSFQGDRRLLRLLIFRYFADMAWAKFKRARATQEQQEQVEDGVANA